MNTDLVEQHQAGNEDDEGPLGNDQGENAIEEFEEELI